MAGTMQGCRLSSAVQAVPVSSSVASASMSRRCAVPSSQTFAVKEDILGKRGSLSYVASGSLLWRLPQLSSSKKNKSFPKDSRVFILAKAAQQGNSSNGKERQTIAITGATGFVGTRLVQRLLSEGHTVRVLTRSASKARSIFPAKDYPQVEIAEQADWAKCISGTTGVVNLAGTPITGRWNNEIKKEIKTSRVMATTKVVEAINATPKELRPSVFVSGTAVGFYGSTSESSAFDESSPSGENYLAEVCRTWEEKAQGLDKSIRLVRLRTGIVLDKGGGALAQMVPLFQIFAGGPVGTGKQWFSWVHRDDLVSLIMEALSNPAYEGAINGTAPNPVRFTELCDRLGSVLGRPSWLPVPDFALKAILGEGASVVLEGQRVLPKRAQELGFTFKYQYVTDALKAILA